MCWKFVAAIFLCVTAVISTMRPASAQTVDEIFLSPGMDVQAIVDAAPEGQAFVFECGVYREQTIIPMDGQTFDGQDCAELNGARILTGWQFDGTYWTLSGLWNNQNRFHINPLTRARHLPICT